MIDVTTPKELRNARKKAGISQTKLAEEVGISHPAISQIESGNNDPRLSTVIRIANVINELADE